MSSLIETFLSKPAEVHSFVGGFSAARSGREKRVVRLAFGEVEPKSNLEKDIQEQGWYALGGIELYHRLP